jgi:acyl-CoA thioesterase-1
MRSFYLSLICFLGFAGTLANDSFAAPAHSEPKVLQEVSKNTAVTKELSQKSSPADEFAKPRSPATSSAENVSAGAADPKILVLGDSISAGYGMNIDDGWVNLMNQTLIQRESPWRLINASISGETTIGGLKRLPELLETYKPQIVVLELGGNDGLRGYPAAKIRANLLTMTQLVKKAGAKPVIITMRIPPNYGPRYTRAFESVFVDAAAQGGAALVPFLFEAVAASRDLMQADGIHPTAAAQPLLVEGFLPYLESLM